jgi:hypothetical protein
MGLSPLYPTLTSDLHVSTVGDLPSEFPPTSINSGIIHNLSGPSIRTITRSKTLLLIRQQRYNAGTHFKYASLSLRRHGLGHLYLLVRQTPRSVFQDGAVTVTIHSQYSGSLNPIYGIGYKLLYCPTPKQAGYRSAFRSSPPQDCVKSCSGHYVP